MQILENMDPVPKYKFNPMFALDNLDLKRTYTSSSAGGRWSRRLGPGALGLVLWRGEDTICFSCGEEKGSKFGWCQGGAVLCES